MLPSVLTNEVAANERMELYLGGGVLMITARILTVDMLCERVPLAQIGGLIVADAQRVSDVSNVGFILINLGSDRTSFNTDNGFTLV